MMALIQAGAALFAEPVRRAVADGPPFAIRDRGFYVRHSDLRDVLAALLFEAGLADVAIAGGTFAARHLGVDVARAPRDWRIRALCELTEINDHGGYADGAALRRALLGEEG
jgi:hypothetical protein